MFFGLFLICLAYPINATITEARTECDLFDCCSWFSIDADLSLLSGQEYVVSKNTFTYGEIREHIGDVKNLRVSVVNDHTIKVCGNIGGATTNLWGFSFLGDDSHLNSSWWNSTWNTCKNITLEEKNGVARVNEIIDINVSSIVFTDDGELRVIEGACQESQNVTIAYEILENSSSSVRIVFFANASANANTTFAVYYNATGSVDEGSSELFYMYEPFDDAEYTTNPAWFINDGTWSATGGFLNHTGGSTVDSISDMNQTVYLNKVNITAYWKMTGTRLTYIHFSNKTNEAGNYYPDFGYDIYCDAPNEGFAFYKGDDSHTQVNQTSQDADCHNSQFRAVYMTRINTGYWEIYNDSQDGLLLLTAQDTTYPEFQYITFVGYVDLGGEHKLDDFFLSQYPFRIYTNPLDVTLGGVEHYPVTTPTAGNCTFVEPTPSDGVFVGWDYNAVINMTFDNNSASIVVIEWDGVNRTPDVIGSNYTHLTPNSSLFSGGHVYSYIGYVYAGNFSNNTGRRSINVSYFSTSEIAHRLDAQDLGIILIFIVLIGMFIFLVRR